MDPENHLHDLSVDQRTYRFFPTREEEKINFGKANGTRIIFRGHIEHDDHEKKKLAEFKEYLKGKQHDQKYYNDHMLVLFLYSNSYKNDAAYQDMKNHSVFKQKYIEHPNGDALITYHNDEKARKLVDNGFFYICGRDNFFRPTIIFNLPKTDLKDPQVVLRAVVLVQQQAIRKLMIPGQAQCWNIIFDVGGMGITDIPVNALKDTLQIISSNYSGRLYKLWLVNAPGTIYFSWKIVSKFLDSITVDKITIVKKNTDDSFWKYYDKSQIEKKYGGTQPDRTTFYPFKLPPATPDEKRLITEEKYAQLVNSGKLKNNVLHPKFNKKAEQTTEK